MTNRNPIDRQHTLTPRDYLETPVLFGYQKIVRFVTPPGGTETSRQAAEVLHHLAVAALTKRVNGTQVATKWGFSKQAWSDLLNGRHWPSTTLLIAMMHELRH